LLPHHKMLRLEPLKVKADLERELGQLVPRLFRLREARSLLWRDSGASPDIGRNREPAPHGEPSV